MPDRCRPTTSALPMRYAAAFKANRRSATRPNCRRCWTLQSSPTRSGPNSGSMRTRNEARPPTTHLQSLRPDRDHRFVEPGEFLVADVAVLEQFCHLRGRQQAMVVDDVIGLGAV